jgi:hypothetical protein
MKMQKIELQNNYILKVALTEENIRQFYGSLPENYTCQHCVIICKKPTSVFGNELPQKAILFPATLHIHSIFSKLAKITQLINSTNESVMKKGDEFTTIPTH